MGLNDTHVKLNEKNMKYNDSDESKRQEHEEE